MQCVLCETEEASEGFHVGNACAGKLGLRPFPPSSRPRLPCTRCRGTRFIRAMPREFTASLVRDGNATSYLHSAAAPMALTIDPATHDRWIRKGNVVDPPDIVASFGTLETYVCEGCGFIEWYCQDPKAIPIGHQYNTEIVDVGAEPYR